MTSRGGTFQHDSSDRLAFEIFDARAEDYPLLCRRIIDHFELVSTSDQVIGLDLLTRGYTDGSRVVGLAWDNWSGFIVTAEHPQADTLVREIAEFLMACSDE